MCECGEVGYEVIVVVVMFVWVEVIDGYLECLCVLCDCVFDMVEFDDVELFVGDLCCEWLCCFVLVVGVYDLFVGVEVV